MNVGRALHATVSKASTIAEWVLPAANRFSRHRQNPFSLPPWLPELRKREVLRADLVAGLTVALVLIPQSMAYAQLAGLPPYYGLYASFMPPMIAAFFGSSRQLATGPVAMVSLMTAAALEPLATAGSESFIAYAILLSLMVGLIQLGLGLFRAGMLLNFLSHPVILGFVNAAAIIIATSQLGKIFGVTVEKGEHHYEFVLNTLAAAAHGTHWPTFFMAALAFAIMFALRQKWPKLPGVLIAVVITSALAWLSGYEHHQSIAVDRIGSAKVQAALGLEARNNREIAVLAARALASQEDLEQWIVNETDTTVVLEMQQYVERLRVRLKAQQSEATQQRAAVRDIPLYAHANPDGSKQPLYYAADEMPVDQSIDGITWHIKSVTTDGRLQLRAGGKVLGEIPSGLPQMTWPTWDWGAFRHLLEAAIAISLIGFMEAISIAKAMAAKTRQRLDADRELIGQGLGNIAGSLFQSYPTSGSFSRSAVNIGAGAITGFSSVVTVMMVVITLLWLTPLLYYLPQATLAAVIMMAVIGLVSIKPFLHSWKANRHDGAVALVTFSLTLVLAPELEKGIILGMLLSLLLLLYRKMKPRVVVPEHYPELLPTEAVEDGAVDDQRIVRMRFEGSLVFSNTTYFEDKLREILNTTPQLEVLIVDGVSINEVDASGDEMLRSIDRRMKETGVNILYTRFKKPVLKVFRRSGLLDAIGHERLHRHPKDAFSHAWRLIRGPDQQTPPPD